MADVPTIDLDAEAILFDGHWYTRDDLARRIKAMLDSGDFNLTRPSQALEQLNTVMASVRTVAFRATPDIVDALNRSAAAGNKTVGNRIRELLMTGLGQTHGPTAPEPSAGPVPPPPTIKPASPAASGGGQVAAPVVAAVPMAGPGALRSAGVHDAPSVVVEGDLQEEGAIELTERKKGEETPSAESRWFKS